MARNDNVGSAREAARRIGDIDIAGGKNLISCVDGGGLAPCPGLVERKGSPVKRLPIAAAVVLGLLLSIGNAEARGPVRAGGNISIGFPVGEYRDNLDRVASGLNGYAVFGLGDLPLSAGGSFSFMTQGSERIGRMQIGPYVGDLVTRNKLLTAHAVIRAQSMAAGVAPFLDLLVGFKRLYTTTEIRIGFNVPDIDMDSDDYVISYGVGCGVAYQIYESSGDGDESGGGRRLSLDLGVRYLMGGEAEYVDIDSVIFIDDRIGYNMVRSRTDMMTVHAGVSFLF